jgi:hypothetical protein
VKGEARAQGTIRMSEETFDDEETGLIFSDEDFGRRYFPEQSPLRLQI